MKPLKEFLGLAFCVVLIHFVAALGLSVQRTTGNKIHRAESSNRNSLVSLAGVDGTGDDTSFSALASPLSQWAFEDETAVNDVPDGEQLEEATDSILKNSEESLGKLTAEDATSITNLMMGWSRRWSVEGAMAVEKLLKRVVEDMSAGNTEVHVTTQMYTIVRAATYRGWASFPCF